VICKNPRGDLPQIHPDAFIDPTAIICGLVVVEENVFIGPCAVIRADEMDADGHIAPIVIGAHSNVQDGVVIHSKSGAKVTVGEHASIAHRATLHGPCTVGNGVFIGFNSVLFNCTVADRCVVRHNAMVDGCHLPAGFYVRSTAQIGEKNRPDLLAPSVCIGQRVFGRCGTNQQRSGAWLQKDPERILNAGWRAYEVWPWIRPARIASPDPPRKFRRLPGSRSVL
jgi:carbonic anhydrase/acetyltransferase-like protein (isoleucine patch superfamily)